MAGHPVTITVGVQWRFNLQPTPPRPPRLSVAVTVAFVILTLARIIFDCPQQPNILNFLLGLRNSDHLC
ncbi:transmembrane protein 272-like isoform X1 [Lates japonicus]|uniref:Transmembrane protein 272-like isoform X1 n=1 Tax=Lates japonicus TaxID=270547 RepID=A0AAD3R2G9_LATJO|nr:transmembrane protein 272-like isoform X1 [Lates japonicus]